MIAKTFMGLEDLFCGELTALGAKDVVKGCRVVSFRGDKEMMYRANFSLRTAIRILKPIKHFTAASADEVYEAIKEIDWSEYIGEDKTINVHISNIRSKMKKITPDEYIDTIWGIGFRLAKAKA